MLVFRTELVRHMSREDISASELARRVGVSPTAPWNWLHGKTIPKPGTMLKVARLFGVSVNQLMYGADNSDEDLPTDIHVVTVESSLDAARVRLSEFTGTPVEKIRLRLEIVSG